MGENRKRDTQRSRIYKAEREAHKQYDADSHWTQTIPNNELQPWVDAVMRRNAIRSRWGRRRIDVSLSRGGGRAHGPMDISLGVGARNEWYILHEIAHCLTWRQGAPHGPEFAGVYLFLVRTVIGDDAAKLLVAKHREHRVRRNNNAIPKAGTHRVEPKRKPQPILITSSDKRLAASIVRHAVKQGEFGPAGRKPRAHALATARLLDPH